MSTKPKILSVDDDPELQRVMHVMLEHEYDVHCVDSGVACLAQASSILPDLILMDVTMLEMDGYETCSCVKADPSIKDIPVMFVSAADTDEEKLKGFEAGGEDYVTKPFNENVLQAKIKLIIESKSDAKRLQSSIKEATSTALLAMRSNGELGVVIDFLRNSFSCKTFDALGEKLLAACGAFELQCSLQIRTQHDNLNMSSGGWCPPLEAQLLAKAQGKDRVIHVKNRTFINYEHISILAKNMPVNDDMVYGELVDHLTVLTEGANMKIDILIKEADLWDRQHQQVTSSARETIEHIKDQFNTHCKETDQIIAELLDDIQSGMLRLGLTEDQEEYFIVLGEKSQQKISRLTSNSSKIDESISNLIDVIS